MIPKVIHYCWLSTDPIPNALQNYMKTWKEKLPDYEFILWNFDRFDINSSQWVKEAFQNKKYAFAADYIRLYAVYHYGGFYMDMDVEVVKSFNDLLDRPYVFGLENGSSIEAGIFGAEKESKLIRDVLDYYKDRSFILADGKFDINPLPNIFFGILSRKYKMTMNTDLYDNNTISAFSSEYFTARDWPYRNYNITENTYAIHHFAASWVSPKYRIKSTLKKMVRQVFGAKAIVFIINNKKKINKLIRKNTI